MNAAADSFSLTSFFPNLLHEGPKENIGYNWTDCYKPEATIL